jgi:hypothetical protein
MTGKENDIFGVEGMISLLVVAVFGGEVLR